MTTITLADRIATLVESSSSGTVSREQALDPASTLTEKGLTSLSFLQLIDAIETELGIYVDLEGDTAFLQTVDGISSYVTEQGGQ
jgi:acyl carrier protein